MAPYLTTKFVGILDRSWNDPDFVSYHKAALGDDFEILISLWTHEDI